MRTAASRVDVRRAGPDDAATVLAMLVEMAADVGDEVTADEAGWARMLARPEVLIDMQFVEITRNDALTYGVDFPTLFTLTPLTKWLNNEVKVPSGISGFLTFGGGKTLMGIGIMNASAVAKLTRATGKVASVAGLM